MIGLNREFRIFFYAGTCDMRRQIAGLVTMVREELGRDPQCGDMYVFRGRRGDQLKILFYDKRGYCMLVKRLDEGTFPIAHAMDSNAVEITLRDLASLLRNAEMMSSVRATA
ncbi:MAG TPA: IS66 family insertion sequence element accessory protein TnpB [Kofleriaceae bacterium]